MGDPGKNNKTPGVRMSSFIVESSLFLALCESRCGRPVSYSQCVINVNR